MEALRLSCGRAAADVAATLDAIEAHLGAAGTTEAEALQLRLVAEEIITNIARCAWPEGEPGRFTVEVASAALAQGVSVRLTTVDDGAPFDPTAGDPPEMDAPLEMRVLGGLGMFLVREMTDRQSYWRASGQNWFSVERVFARK